MSDELNTEDAPESEDADVTDPGYIKPPHGAEDAPPEEEDGPTLFASFKAAFNSGSKLVAFLKVSGLLTAIGLGAYAEMRAGGAVDTAENRTETTYAALRGEIEELWLAQEEQYVAIDDALAELTLLGEDLAKTDLKVRDIRLEDRIEEVEARLRGRRPHAERPPQHVSRAASDEGPPTPEDMVDILERDLEAAERNTRLAEENTKRAKTKTKKARSKLPDAKKFFGQQQQIQIQMQMD